MDNKLALLGGTPVMTENPPEDLFKWPIITEEDEAACLDVIRRNAFSATDLTQKFEADFAKWQNRKYAIAYCNGTMAILTAMFAIGLGAGDEIICPTKTYWGSVSQAINFGASAVFCNINDKLSMDPDDLERCITKKTKAIVVVHYFGYPCDMDRIMEIAHKHNLKVIEDVSHAHGSMYKGRKVGTFGDVAAMSMMSWKAFAAGELGMLVTDDRKIYERSMAFAHYERNNPNFIKECDDLKPYYSIGLGGFKGRANQICVALAMGQLKHFDERCAEIRKAVNYFWDQLGDLPGILPVRVDESTGSHMGGFYIPHCTYCPEALHDLSVKRLCEALRAEVTDEKMYQPGANFCLHTHDFFKTFDLMNMGKPSRIAFSDRDVRLDDDSCKPSESILCFSTPWFKKMNPVWIDKYVEGFRKVIEHHEDLLPGDTEENRKAQSGRWYGMISSHK